jgi:hypothetical protein
MTKFASSFSAVAIMLGVFLHAGAAGATVTTTSVQTWVSGAAGANDSNLCTRTSPCATFQGAYAKTTAGGEIDVLDGGDFGPVNIFHSITIANDGAGTAAITPASGGNGVEIDAGASDVVVLRGLSINGISAGSITVGIQSFGGGALLVDHCQIRGFQQGGVGLLFTPSSNGNGKLAVKDTVLSSDGGSSSAALFIQPTGGGTATVELERVQILNSIGNGVRADATFSGPVDVELHDVTVDSASGGAGIVAVSLTSGGPAVKLLAEHVTSTHNAGYGFKASGGTASIVLRHSTVENNGAGLGASNGGQIFSYGDNSLAQNTGGNGVTPTPIASE